jgi:hypothetical protein
MKRFLLFSCLLLFVVSLGAQHRTGNIYGRVTDPEGNPLPGVSVTLTGPTTAPLSGVSGAEGKFRFLSLYPGKEYAVKLELQGFKTRISTDIIVAVGQDTELTFALEPGAIEEEVTVIAISPVVQTKKTTIVQSVNYETLQSLPTARDPWVILQTTPGIIVDRENVGGNESGQQSGYVSKGSSGFTNWNLDGIVISDPAATGASPTYFDFDVFEELNITTSGQDVESQLGGVVLGLVTRRGGNKLGLAGRFYLTDEKFQNKLTPEQIADFGVPGYNRIRDIKDFGFNVGGPIINDKIWWWGSYGVQEIKTTIIAGTNDDTYLTNLAAKINLQLIPQNRAEIFIHSGKKEKFGRDSSTSFPEGYYQRGKYHFGSPIFKIQDEHMFGDNFFVSAKYGFTDAGFGMSPMNDLDLNELTYYNVEADLWSNAGWFFSGRPHKYIVGQGQYWNENLLGGSHEIKFGVEYDNRSQDYVSGYPGNMYVENAINYPTVDWNMDGTVDTPYYDFGVDLRLLHLLNGGFGSYKSRGIAGYISDTISFGRLTLKLGARYDTQHAKIGELESQRIFQEDLDHPDLKNYYELTQQVLTPGTAEKFASVYPAVKSPEVDPKINWNMFSPRVGLIFDVFGDGRTIAKLSAAMYGEFMSTWQISYLSYGGLWGWMNFWWNDNGDGMIDWRELYWANAGTLQPYRAWDDDGNWQGNWNSEAGYIWGDFDPADPTKLESSYTTPDPKWNQQRTREILFTLEKEIFADFGVALDLSYRIYDKFHASFWYYPDTRTILDDSSFYQPAPSPVPSTVVDSRGTSYDTGDAGGKEWYVLKPDVAYTPYRYYTNWNTDRYNIYYGADFRFNKRLSHKWMLSGSFSLMDQKQYYGTNGYADPTNIWALEGQINAPQIGGGSGKISQPAFSKWLVKLQGLYQLPLDFNISMTLNGRQGFVIPATMALSDPSAPNPLSRSNTIYLRPFGTGERLEDMWWLSMKLEKVLRLGDIGRIYLSVDAFNVLNSHTLNRRRAINLGTYNFATGLLSPYARSGEANEILNPRVLRFGCRFQF